MRKRSASRTTATTRFALLGFDVERYQDQYGSNEIRWQVSRPGEFCILLPTFSEALALIWSAATEGGAA